MLIPIVFYAELLYKPPPFQKHLPLQEKGAAMRNLYYGEIAAKISALLSQNPEYLIEVDEFIKANSEDRDSIYTICADAAMVFDNIEDISSKSSEDDIDWNIALDEYADQLLEHLTLGNTPQMIDLFAIATNSILSAR